MLICRGTFQRLLVGCFPQVDLSALPLRGSPKPARMQGKERACLWQPLGGAVSAPHHPTPHTLFLVLGNSGKSDNLFLLEARHFAARVSSKIGKSRDFGAAGWSREAEGFHGAANERNALNRSQQLAVASDPRASCSIQELAPSLAPWPPPSPLPCNTRRGQSAAYASPRKHGLGSVLGQI